MLNFIRRAGSKATDWREDKAVVKTRARLVELDRLLGETRDRIQARANAAADAEAQVKRAELEVLAGRSTDAQLAAKQQAHLDARVAEAKDRLALEDMQAEKADLEGKLPGIIKTAKRAAHADFQAKAVVLLKELREHLAAAVQAETELALLRNEADNQFPYWGVGDPHQPEHYDPDFAPCAGVPNLTSVTLNRQVGLFETHTVQSRTASVIHDIDEALARLDPQGSK